MKKEEKKRRRAVLGRVGGDRGEIKQHQTMFNIIDRVGLLTGVIRFSGDIDGWNGFMRARMRNVAS